MKRKDEYIDDIEKPFLFPIEKKEEITHYCNFCDAYLEENDKLNKTYKRDGQVHKIEYNCRFCGNTNRNGI